MTWSECVDLKNIYQWPDWQVMVGYNGRTSKRSVLFINLCLLDSLFDNFLLVLALRGTVPPCREVVFTSHAETAAGAARRVTFVTFLSPKAAGITS
jgi:hypothetical protein